MIALLLYQGLLREFRFLVLMVSVLHLSQQIGLGQPEKDSQPRDRNNYRIVTFDSYKLDSGEQVRLINVGDKIYMAVGKTFYIDGYFGFAKWRDGGESGQPDREGRICKTYGDFCLGYDLTGTDECLRTTNVADTGTKWERSRVEGKQGFYLRPLEGAFKGWYVTFEEKEEAILRPTTSVYGTNEGGTYIRYRAKLGQRPGKMSHLAKLSDRGE